MAQFGYSLLHICASLYVVCGLKGFDNHPCDRECTEKTNPMTCSYEMFVETYATMSKACFYCPFLQSDCDREDCIPADGFSRLLYTVNRKLPGPQIRVCEGDTLKVKVKNHMSNGEGLTIHWHGLHLQDHVSMDGATMITQCPILPMTEFTYTVKAEPHGTHWYHSHVGSQRADGLAGALVIKQKLDPHSTSYDHDSPEHTILLQDWFKNLASGKGALHLHARDNNRPDSLLINGKAPGNVSWPLWSKKPKEPDTSIPYTVFNVTQGTRYRFRLISNAAMNCPMEVYIDNHTLLVIASDGSSIQPVEADVLVISGGERWDFILNASASVDNYWIYVRGLTDCSQRKTQTLAILHYKGSNYTSPSATPKGYDERPSHFRTINPFSLGMVNPDLSDNHLILTELRSAEKLPDWLMDPPDKKLYLRLGLHRVDNPLFNVPGLYGWTPENQDAIGTVLAQINRVHGKLPSWPYLTQYSDIPDEDFCDLNSESINETFCSHNFCSCVHRVQIELGDIVEVIMLDQGEYWNISNHPMHIHGTYLHVISVGQNETMMTSKELVSQLDKEFKISRNFDRPIAKDTFMIPDGGYVIGRFKATNPGPWLFHCHNELHVEQGMVMVFQVGNPKQWPTESSQHKCGASREINKQIISSSFKISISIYTIVMCTLGYIYVRCSF